MFRWRLIIHFAAALATCWAAAGHAEQISSEPFPVYEKRILPVTDQGRHYQLYVGLPASYGWDQNKR